MNDIVFHDSSNKQNDNPLALSNEARAVAEVQAAYVIAKKFPRNSQQSYMQIMDACKRMTLAEQAVYTFPRGRTNVTGASIRLAEAVAQCWGNIECGVRELSQSNGMSIAEAFAIDLQTNTRVTKTFHVPHTRDTRQGKQKLTDAREIYMEVANQGSRRLRACILAVIPGDIIEAAVQQCEKTLQSDETPISERVKKLIVAFDEIGVKVEHIEKMLQHNLDAIIEAELVKLRGIYKSIKDGMAVREDFFEISGGQAAKSAKNEVKAMLSSPSEEKSV